MHAISKCTTHRRQAEWRDRETGQDALMACKLTRRTYRCVDHMTTTTTTTTTTKRRQNLAAAAPYQSPQRPPHHPVSTREQELFVHETTLRVPHDGVPVNDALATPCYRRTTSSWRAKSGWSITTLQSFKAPPPPPLPPNNDERTTRTTAPVRGVQQHPHSRLFRYQYPFSQKPSATDNRIARREKRLGQWRRCQVKSTHVLLCLADLSSNAVVRAPAVLGASPDEDHVLRLGPVREPFRQQPHLFRQQRLRKNLTACRAERSRAEQSRAEQSRAEQERRQRARRSSAIRRMSAQSKILGLQLLLPFFLSRWHTWSNQAKRSHRPASSRVGRCRCCLVCFPVRNKSTSPSGPKKKACQAPLSQKPPNGALSPRINSNHTNAHDTKKRHQTHTCLLVFFGGGAVRQESAHTS